MGHTQFEPSDFEKFAADGDGDGKVDLENSIPDALASAAKQLRDYGWKRGKQWGFEVRIPRELSCTEASPDLKRSLADWLDLGLMPAFGAEISRDILDDQAWLLLPAGAYGPGFLALENFQALRQYNASDLYALFVGNLADRIAGGPVFERPWAKLQQFSSRDVEEIQTLLSKKKFYLDPVDGRPGSLTRRANRTVPESGRYPHRLLAVKNPARSPTRFQRGEQVRTMRNTYSRPELHPRLPSGMILPVTNEPIAESRDTCLILP